MEKIPGQNQDCGCEGNCCPPKRNNLFTKILFLAVILAAAGIIVVKLFIQPVPGADKQMLNKGAAAGCDSSAAKTCDTTKGSSCCPKSK